MTILNTQLLNETNKLQSICNYFMEWTIKEDDNIEHYLGQINLLPMLSNYSYLDIISPVDLKKQSSMITSNILIQAKPIKSQEKEEPTNEYQIKVNECFSQLPQNEELFVCTKYYSKNACKNIVKKCLRSIQQSTYKQQLSALCSEKNIKYECFYQQAMIHLQNISGPSALKRLLKNEKIGQVFRTYLIWYLKQRYIRQALRAGHMRNLKIYIQYKNNQLVKMLRKK